MHSVSVRAGLPDRGGDRRCSVYRLLAEVTTVDLAKSRRDRSGLEYDRYDVRARVLGSAMEALPAPDGVVGRDVRLVRECLRPWKVRKGDLLVLDPAESARVLCRRRPRAEEDLPSGAGVRLETLDIDRDGFEEQVVSNAFARAVFQWHRGARLASLEGASGSDRLTRSYEYLMAGKYILLGGVEPFIAEAGSPGEIWKSSFEAVDGEPPSDGSYRSSHRRTLESPAGVSLAVGAAMLPGLPGIAMTYEAGYAGKPPRGGEAGPGESGETCSRAGEKDEPDTTEVTLGVRAFTNPAGPVPSLNVFEIPCSDGVHSVRFHPPTFGRRWRWRDWRNEHFAVRGGFAVSRNEALGNALVMLFGQRKVSFVSVRSDYTGPELDILHKTRKLAKGRRHAVGAAFLVADAVSVARSAMFMAAIGSGRRGRRQVAFVLRTPGGGGGRRATLTCADRRRTLTLTPLALPEAGTVWTGTLELGRSAFPLRASVRAGAQHLELGLEG